MLDGIIVLDLASVGPAARASRWLADYGASVVKVGPVPARGGTQIVPPYHAYSGNRAMKRVLVDLKVPAGTDTFLRLADRADVVLESFRPGVVDRLGVGYDAVAARNPRIVYCATTGYGQTGPRAAWAGHDLDYLAVSGYLDCSGRGPAGLPALPGATIADSAGGGMHAAMAILAALVRRGATGQGAYLDVAVADGMLSLMALQVDEHLAEGTIPGPGHGLLTGRYACYGIYAAGDGASVAVAAIESRFWANLCNALGLSHLVDRQYDDASQDEVRSELQRTFATQTRNYWVARLGPANTCVAPVLSVEEVTTDPQFQARRAFATAWRGNTRFAQVGAVLAGMPPVADSEARGTADTDTDDVLAAAMFTKDDVAQLRKSGVVA